MAEEKTTLGMTKEELDAKMAEIDARLKTEAPSEAPKAKKVAVLGFTDSWKTAPFGDESWEIWGLNELYMFIPRWTRWFELHKREVYEADKKRVSDHVERLKQMTCPVYMHQHFDDIPTSVPYPLQAICDAFPNPTTGQRPYLTNSISYMILLAAYEGFEEIKICGVDMSHDCLHPDMRVLTADLRWVRVGDLSVGQDLLAFDEEIPMAKGEQPAQFRKYRRTTVESLSTIKRPCYRLHMADGTTLISSAGHPWMIVGGIDGNRHWLTTEKLQPQNIYPQRTSKIVKLMNVWQEDRSWDAGYLAAAFDGEGHLSQTKRTNCSSTGMAIGFAQRPNGMSNAVEQALQRYGFDFGCDVNQQDGCNKYHIRGGRSELLRFLGQVRPRRLLHNFDPDGVGTLNSIDNVPVLASEFIGEQEVVGIRTGTQTLIVEGYASHNSEYGHQRPSCEWAVGIAQGRGIKVWLPMESDLMKTNFLYGYEEPQATAFEAKMKARRDDIRQKRGQMEQQFKQMEIAIQQHFGAEQDIEHILKIWNSTPH